MSKPSASLPPPSADQVLADVRRALAEDIGTGDVNVDFLPAQAQAQAHVLCREAIVLAGSPWFDACVHELDPDATVHWHHADGDPVPAGSVLCQVHGRARALLSAERSALNFLQTLSATATTTAQYVAAVAGTDTVVLDTRKTLPGLRTAQKYAVRCGGGHNHRMGLFDALLIKENHIAAAGGIAAAVTAARAAHPGLLLVLEVETLNELDQAIACGVDRVMLDEFDDAALQEALARTRGKLPVEVSGNVDLPCLRQLAQLGVDFVSIGALTKHVRAVDLSMRIET